MRIAEQGARNIAAALDGMRTKDCKTLRTHADATARVEQAKTDARQADFDKRDGPLDVPEPPPALSDVEGPS